MLLAREASFAAMASAWCRRRFLKPQWLERLHVRPHSRGSNAALRALCATGKISSSGPSIEMPPRCWIFCRSCHRRASWLPRGTLEVWHARNFRCCLHMYMLSLLIHLRCPAAAKVRRRRQVRLAAGVNVAPCTSALSTREHRGPISCLPCAKVGLDRGSAGANLTDTEALEPLPHAARSDHLRGEPPPARGW